MDSAKKMVDEKIASKKVMVFSKSWCPHSKKAREVLAKYNLPKDDYEEWYIDHANNCDDIQDYLKTITKARTVPRVFIGGKCIGGGSETKALDESGELKAMLEQVLGNN